MKKYIIPLLVIIIAIGGLLVYLNKTSTVTPNTPQLIPTSAVKNQTKNYTLAEIANHQNATDCWMAVESKVYNVSTFIASGKHKGGLAILNGCGKETTELFNNRPGSGTPHSQKARELLSQFYIGDLGK